MAIQGLRKSWCGKPEIEFDTPALVSTGQVGKQTEDLPLCTPYIWPKAEVKQNKIFLKLYICQR